MDDLKINTVSVRAIAQNLRRYNNEMRNGLNEVKNSIRQLDSAWDGSASSNAIHKFYSICNTFDDARYKTLDNYAAVLSETVGAGYEVTETQNQSLADTFK